MSFQLKGLLAIAILVALIALIIWAPWKEHEPDRMPSEIFEPYEGNWECRFSAYSISGDSRESFRQTMKLASVDSDSLVGEFVRFSPGGDTLSRDSVYYMRRGDSLYALRRTENGERQMHRGYWVDGQIIWRSQDIFGRTHHAYREYIRKDIWEIHGFTRTDRGDYLLEYGRAMRR